MDNPETSLAEFKHEYTRSAKVGRATRQAKPKAKPKTRRVSELTPAQLEARRAAKRAWYEQNKYRVNEAKRYKRTLVHTIERESVKRFKDRREYIAPLIDKATAQMLLLMHQGMSAEQAWQEVNRPKGLPMEWKARPPRLESIPSGYNPPARTEVMYWNPRRGPWYKPTEEFKTLKLGLA